jgi:hypothetical protein
MAEEIAQRFGAWSLAPANQSRSHFPADVAKEAAWGARKRHWGAPS